MYVEDDVSSTAAKKGFRTLAIRRSLTLLRVFLVASAVILVAGALALSWVLTTTLRRQSLADQRTSLTQYVDGVLRPQLVRADRLHVSSTLPHAAAAQLRRQPDLKTIKVWRPDGLLVWTNRDRERIGRRFPLEGDLGETIRDGEATAAFDDLGDTEDAAEAALGLDHVLEVYAPLRTDDGRRVLGAYEIYADPARTEMFINERKHVIWLAVAAVFAALYLALALLVRGASTTLRRQSTMLRTRSRELLESYRRLQASSLEAIASLNATVDAKDPYTAGHSARVQQIALAIAEELRLPRERFDAVRYGGLFHDIGKIAVPDAILAKPGPLTAAEYDVIKRHPVDGADIVGKLGALSASVRLIRHHHERWDGEGYPDRLAGDEIPPEACVIGLADAWDAMTTDRPYREALTVEEAAGEVRRGRGTQFAPDVVDAFLAALARRRVVFEPDVSIAVAAAG
jgi:putative nucleotidyltransferase with HDIG domain